MTTPITPKSLAATLEVSPKALRSYLRKNHTRDASVKGSNWTLDTDTVKAVTAHFTKA